MKHLLLLLLFALPICAQNKAFTIRNNAVVWENVFVTNETNIASILEKHPSLTIQSDKDNIYKGIARNLKNSCPGTSEAFIDARYDFNFEIEKSAGMYRVTIFNLKILPTGKKQPLIAESFFIEKGEIKNTSQNQVDMQCLDAFFNRIFTATSLLKNKP
jgi:hypothetical protein